MKRLLSSAALALVLSTPVYAQTAAPFVTSSQASDIRSSRIVGIRVYVSEDEYATNADAMSADRTEWDGVGEVSDVLLTSGGDVRAVLIDVGGFLGIGEKTVAVSMDSIRLAVEAEDDDDRFVVFSGDRKMLDAATAFDDRDPAMASASSYDKDWSDRVASLRAPMVDRDGWASAEPATLTAERLAGADLLSIDDEVIGSVDTLVLNNDGSVKDIVLNVGGWAGMGGREVSMPLEKVRILRENDSEDLRVYVDMTREQLESMPEFKG